MKLIDVLPSEFETDFRDTKAYKFKNVEVLKEIDGCIIKFPGSHKFVFNWYKLENGYVVGWNENPTRGWSFPVIKIKN